MGEEELYVYIPSGGAEKSCVCVSVCVCVLGRGLGEETNGGEPEANRLFYTSVCNL